MKLPAVIAVPWQAVVAIAKAVAALALLFREAVRRKPERPSAPETDPDDEDTEEVTAPHVRARRYALDEDEDPEG